MKSRLVAGAALLILSAANAAADETVVMDGRFALARPLMVIPPKFPNAPLPREPVEVHVRGRLSVEGRLLDPLVTAPIGNEAYISSVSAVVADWRFVPAIGRDCKPVEEESVLYVWFQAKDGEPSVHVSFPPERDPSSTWPRVKGATTLVRKKEPHIEYPARLNYAGVEGIAIVVLKVARTGEVVDSSLRAVSPVDEFGYPALKGLQRISFEPFETDPPGLDAICGEYVVNYCIGYKDVRVAHPYCAAKRGNR